MSELNPFKDFWAEIIADKDKVQQRRGFIIVPLSPNQTRKLRTLAKQYPAIRRTFVGNILAGRGRVHFRAKEVAYVRKQRVLSKKD